MKAERDCDLRIVGWYAGLEGTKRAESIGGFNLQTDDGMLQVQVGSGFKDKVLDEIMANGPDSYIGKIAKVKFNEVISKKDSDIKSLFLPRFIEIRVDKQEPNTLEYIVNR
jgi:DNA ligase-1